MKEIEERIRELIMTAIAAANMDSDFNPDNPSYVFGFLDNDINSIMEDISFLHYTDKLISLKSKQINTEAENITASVSINAFLPPAF